MGMHTFKYQLHRESCIVTVASCFMEFQELDAALIINCIAN